MAWAWFGIWNGETDMSTSSLVRGSGLTGIVFGVLVGASAVVRLLSGDPVAAAWLAFAGVTFGLFALMGLYLPNVERMGLAGLIGFAVAVIGFALSLGQLYGLTFTPKGTGPLGSAFPLGYGPFLFGLLLFDAVIIWTQVHSRWGAALLVIGAAMNAAGFAAVEVRLLGVLVFAAGIIWLGLSLAAGASAHRPIAAGAVRADGITSNAG
jgi:hypothetical protein